MINEYSAFGMPLTSAEVASCLGAMGYPPEHTESYKLRDPADNDCVKAILAALRKESAVKPKSEALGAAFGHPQMSDRELIVKYGQFRRLNSAKLAKHNCSGSWNSTEGPKLWKRGLLLAMDSTLTTCGT